MARVRRNCGLTVTDQNSERLPYAAAALTGFIVCLAIAAATGRSEAWDSGAYLILGIPLMCLVIFGISYVHPRKAWRWTFSMAVGQAASMLLSGSSLSLWPLAIIAMTFWSIPQFVTGSIASKLALRRKPNS